MKKEYIIKSFEPVYGYEFFIVKVSGNFKEEDVYVNLKMAKKYSLINYETFTGEFYKEDYDDNYDEMFEFCKQNHGQNIFNYYLEKFCGYEIVQIKEDFCYEW